MPRRDDLRTIMVLGSGPIVIGQAGEFDYSGTQGCRALRDEGYRIVLVNSNPATIMTDPDVADRTYVEPLDVEAAERIIQVEQPDAILPTLGGQTALNLAIDLAEAGVLERHGVELIGADVDVIRRAGLKLGVGAGRTGPRLHDLRHSMVVNRMLQWYRSGINPQDRLPFSPTAKASMRLCGCLPAKSARFSLSVTPRSAKSATWSTSTW
jgi:hypothetical protein